MDRYVFKKLDGEIVNFKEQFCIMKQSTGLSDSKGMPVFEGDILSNINSSDLYEVVWDYEGAMFILKNIWEKSSPYMLQASDIPDMVVFEE